MNKILTQFKREFWECRASFVYTPLVLCVVVLALILWGGSSFHITVGGQTSGWQVLLDKDRKTDEQAQEELKEMLHTGELFGAHPEILSGGLGAVHSLFILVLLLVLPSYLLSSLYSDRRDQSILFWKSLPVTESQTVLTKLGAALLGAPLFYGAAAVATTGVVLVLLSAYAGWVQGIPLPGPSQILGAYLGSIFGLVVGWALLILWALPLFCWLLFCSALARKAPFLMASGIPLGLGGLELWLLGSKHLFVVLWTQFTSAFANFTQAATEPNQIVPLLNQSLTAPPFWGGLLVSVLLVAGSICLRNYRHEV